MAELAGYTVWVPTLMLVIFRVAGIFITAPLLSNAAVPVKVKAAMAIVVALAVTARLAVPVTLPADWPTLVLGIGGEMLIGAALGFATNLMFMGVQMGAQQIGQQMGIALANVFNPLAEATTNVMGTLFHLTAVAVFLAIGGHRMMLQGLLGSFEQVPLLGFAMRPAILEVVVGLMTAAFVLAVKVAAPVLVTLMLTSVAMGLIQRTMPQFNILSAGFQVRILAAGLVLAVGVPSLIYLIEQGWAVTMRCVAQWFGAPAP